MPIDPHPVEAPGADTANTLAETTINPTDGGVGVHVDNLPSTAGPAAGGSSLSVVSAVSTSGLACSLTLAAGTAQRLATPWSAGATFAVGALTVFPNGNVGKCTASTGVTGGTAPTTTGEAVADGSNVTWIIVLPFKNGGLSILNTDPTTPLYWDFYRGALNVSVGGGGYVGGNGGSVIPQVQDPSLIQVVSAAAILISVEGAS
jgi:hypothetical protein